ncbi:MAG: AAA domain-containing protein [Oscillospiraceae bacterium]|nr:AAA domain-containing protein [Oscillospiraceae bacterium]
MNQNLRDKMRARMEEVRAQAAERDDLVEVIAIALLTRKNVFILGDTGQAKSYAVNLFRAGITGARQFERLMSKQTDEEALFGRLDLSSLIPGGVPEHVLEQDALYSAMYQKLKENLDDTLDGADEQRRELLDRMALRRRALSELHSCEPSVITRGKIPDSHICFLDEIFKASDGILNALLTALNERRYTNEGKTIGIPTISFFSASNEIPNFNAPEEKILKPLYDRFELKVVTEYVESRDARLAVLKRKQGQRGQPPIAAPISLAELEEMQRDVQSITVPDRVNELMDDVLCELRSRGVHISDRKYFGYAPIAQAKAWLEGRDAVGPADLTILRHYLWTAPEERAMIQSVLERMCSDPLKERLDGILTAALESYQDFESSAGSAPNTRRIGKLRDEFIQLYEKLEELRANAQSDGELRQIADCVSELEGHSKKAHEASSFCYAPLDQIYALKAG